VVVVGCGGVGSGAIQARASPARATSSLDRCLKLEKAKEIGATHTAASLLDAQMLLPSSPWPQRRRRDPHPGVLKGDLIAAACACGSKDAASW